MIVAGMAAAGWLTLLWYAAPLAGGDADEPADRVAGMLVVGTLTALFLGFVHLLYAPVLVLAAVVLCAVRRFTVRHMPAHPDAPAADRAAVAVVVAVTVAVAWPALVRPLLEGDSLSYHLPNAASWVQAGSLWETGTRYWWYPGGSELFAAALYAVAGPYSIGLCGTLAILLLGLRILAWGRRCAAPPMLAALGAGATVSTLTVGLQAGNLMNDGWLGAFFLELLYDARFAPRKLPFDAAVCALVKPYGWAFALYGTLTTRRRSWDLLLPAIAVGAWFLRDALLWRHALIAPESTAFPALYDTTIVANGVTAAAQFFAVLGREDPWLLVLVAAPILGLAVLRDRGIAAAGVVALVAYAFLPFSYRTAFPQLTNGHSLRFALPAFAVGGVVAVLLLRRAWIAGAALCAVAGVLGAQRLLGIFWIDPATHAALLAGAAAGLAVALERRIGPAVTVAVAAGLIVAANVSAGRHAVERYDELLQPARSRLFEWLAARRPARIVVSDVPAGAVVVASPATRVYDVVDPAPCDEARTLHAALVFRRRPPAGKTIFPSAVRQFAACGPVLYQDDAVRVVQPAGAP